MKKVLSVIISVMLMVTALPLGAFNLTARGIGTASSPYLIQTKVQLNNVRNNLSAHYKLVANIVFDAEDSAFEPIGSSSTDAFSGTFDGNGFSIVGINISNSSTEYTGLFGYSTGTIKNLGMVEGNIKASRSESCTAGGIVGLNYGVIENCYNTSSVTTTSSNSYQAISRSGGIAGTNYQKIINCYNIGTLQATASSTYSAQAYAGGIAGYSSGSIYNCYNAGSVSISTTAGSSGRHIRKVGGICATNNGGSINYCYYLNTNSSGIGDGTGKVTRCTETELKQQSTFIGFDFENVWQFDETLELHKFPVLKNIKHIEDGNLADYVDGGYIYTVVNGLRYSLKDGVATLVEAVSTLGEEVAIPSQIIYKDIVYNVTGIGYAAFSGYSNLTEIAIPKSITNIAISAFKDCTNITDVWYEGYESDKDSITIIPNNNMSLLSANWHYDSCMKNYDEHSHTYEGCTDANCNNCNKKRSVPAHVYDGCYDRICNACDFVRDNDHFYSNDWDKSCDICGQIRSVGPFTITYHLDGGTNALKNPDMYTEEDSITLKDATKHGYDFAGWFLDANKTEQITEICMMGNVELYAKFLPKSYNATFDCNGAEKSSQITITLHTGITSEKKSVLVNTGDSFSPYDYWQPEVSGYVFAGWTYNSNLINNQMEITEDIDLYAKWVENPNGYPVLGEDITSAYACCNEKYFYISCNYTRIYYSLLAQKKTVEVLSPTTHLVQYRYSASSRSFISADGLSVSLPGYSSLENGRWESDDYVTLKPGTLVHIYNGQSGDTGNVSVAGYVKVETTQTTQYNDIIVSEERTQSHKYDSVINAPSVSKTGYELLGWYDTLGNRMTDTWQYTEDKAFTAKWQPKNYDIAYKLEGGTNSPENPSNYTIEDTITLKDPTKPGYTFKGWYSDANFTTKVTSISNSVGNIVLYAKWEVNSYNLTLDANAGAFAPNVTFVSDGVEIKRCYLYENDTITAYRPDNKEGYIFAGWYTDYSFTSLFKFNGTIANDITLYAKWIKCDSNIVNIELAENINTTIQGKTEQLYAFVPLVDGTITVTSKSNNLDLYGILYDASKNILISADDISDTDLDFAYTYSVKAGQLYYVAVKGNTVSTAGQAIISVDCTCNCTITGTTYQNRQFAVAYDTNYKLPPKPVREGYVFLGWFDENDTQITDGIWNFVSDKTLTAKWEEATYHTVVFKDIYGNVISSEIYYLSEDLVAPKLPEKAPDETYIYHAKWDNNYTGVCAGDAVYTVVFDKEYIKYTVVFRNWDGSLLSAQYYHWGDVVIPPADPTRAMAADYSYIYTFAGWNNSVVNCSGDTTYTAMYYAVPLKQVLLISQPDKVRYKTGETLDLSGLNLQGVYYNGAIISLNNTVAQYNNVDFSTPGRKTVIITIAGVVAEFEIYVHDAEKIVVTVDPSLYPQSSHNYGNNLYETKTFTYPGAQSLVITFNNQTSVESNYDYIFIYDGAGNQIAKYTGTTAANKTLTIMGDTFKVKLTSDHSNTRYGYAFSSIQANMKVGGEIIHQPVIDPATVTCTQSGLTEGSHCDICGDILVPQEEVAALGHDYKTVFIWSEDHTSCTVEITCENGCGLYEKANCAVTHSGLNQAQTIHTATAEYNGITFTDVLTCDNYLIIFEDWDATEISSTYYHYGNTITIPNTPTRAADKTYTYTFAGWDTEVVDCVGNATYTATYTPNYIEYTVEFKDWDGSVLSTNNYHYGNTVTTPNTPTRAADKTYTYTFAGWDTEVVDCVGNATYTATYIPSYIEYTVEFKDWDGSVLSTQYYHWGDEVTVPANPFREFDDTYIYTFAGWDKEVTKCNGNVIYTAIYNKTLIQVTSISIKSNPEKLIYVEGESFDSNGMVVIAYYNNNTSAVITDYIISGYDSTLGIKTITITYEGKTATFEVEVLKAYTPGDIDDNGDITLDDVVALAQIVAGWQNVAHNEAALDVNGDGGTTLDDVVLLAQFVAGWNVTLS